MWVKDRFSRGRTRDLNRFRTQSGKSSAERRNWVRQFQALLATLPLTALSAILFAGGSYLFFIQLAEYGW